jgi:hypothetical protein
MAEYVGLNSRVGAAIEDPYGTEEVVTRKICLVSDSLDKLFTPIPHQGLCGNAVQCPPDQGTAAVSGALSWEWTYDVRDPLLETFFGLYTDEPTGLDHYDFQNATDDRGFTLALDKSVSVHTYIGSKINSLTISGAPGEPLIVEAELMALDRIRNSVLNTSTILKALTAPGRRVLYHHAVNNIWIGDLADPLTVADNRRITAFSLTINRNLTEVYTQSQTPSQPRAGDFTIIELSLTMETYGTDLWLDAHENHTPLQAQFSWVLGTAQKVLRFPILYVTGAPVPTDGPGVVPQEVTFTGHNDCQDANAHTGFDFNEPFRLLEAAAA